MPKTKFLKKTFKVLQKWAPAILEMSYLAF